MRPWCGAWPLSQADAALRLLIWQWGKLGGGPRFAAELADGLNKLPATQAALSLARGAELLRAPDAPVCALPVDTYAGMAGLVGQLARAPVTVPRLAARVAALAPDAAVCAMPGPLDLLMAAALRRARVPFFVVVHDAQEHPGDGFPLQYRLQRVLTARADGLIALSSHVAGRLRERGEVRGRPLLRATHPPRRLGAMPPPPRAHGGPWRLLMFGRLLPYKGLDLLLAALRRLGPRPDLVVQVAGRGPDSSELQGLAALPGVRVENRWVPEDEMPGLIAWADALVLPYREASQSGIAATALAARRYVVATSVGGIAEQVSGDPMALLCEPEADALAGALQRLITAPPAFVAEPAPDGSMATLRQAIAEAVAGRRGCEARRQQGR